MMKLKGYEEKKESGPASWPVFLRPAELNRGNIVLTNIRGDIYDKGKNYIGDYTEIKLSSCRHSLFTESRSAGQTIDSHRITSNEMLCVAYSEPRKKFTVNLSLQSFLFIRCSAMEDPSVFLRLYKLRIFIGTCCLFLV